MLDHTERVRARQHALRDQGLCISCGNESSISPHTGKPYSLCDRCRKKNNERSKKSHTKKKDEAVVPRGEPAAITTTGQHYHVIETGEVGKVSPCPCADPLVLKFKDGILDAFHLFELEETSRPLTASINRGVVKCNGYRGKPKGMESGTITKMLQIYRLLRKQTEPVYRAQIQKAVGFNITRPLMIQKSMAQCVTLESLGIVERVPGERTWAAWQLTELGRADGERIIKSLYTKGKQDAGRRFRAKAVANGRCSRCGRHPARPGLKTCGLCSQVGATTAEQHRAKNHESMQKRRASNGGHLCTTCLKREPQLGYKVCDKCLDAAADRRDRLKQSGMCNRCGKRPPRQHLSSCKECAEYYRVRAQKQSPRTLPSRHVAAS